MSVDVPTLFHVSTYPSTIPFHVLRHLEISEDDVAVRELTLEELRTDEEIGTLLPNRVVPVLLFPDGQALYETGAILLHLIETYDADAALMPPLGHERRPYFLQGFFFALTDGFEALAKLVPLCRDVDDEDRDAKAIEAAVDNFEDVLNNHIISKMRDDDRPFYSGDDVCAVDLILAYLLDVFEWCSVGRNDSAFVEAYVNRLRALPSHQEVYPELTELEAVEEADGAEMADPEAAPEEFADAEPADMEDDTRREIDEEEDSPGPDEILTVGELIEAEA